MLKNLLLGFALLVSVATLTAQKSPAGYVIQASCEDYTATIHYFYKNGTVIASRWDCSHHEVYTGTWTMEDGEITISYAKSYRHVPYGDVIEMEGNCVTYSGYKSTIEKINMTEQLSWYDGIVADAEKNEESPCAIIRRFDETINVQYILRVNPIKEYETSTRLLTEAELQKYTPFDLKIMRNEIFSQYGFKFQSTELSDYFANKREAPYFQMSNDVTAFLTDIEIKNIATIKKVEATKK